LLNIRYLIISKARTAVDNMAAIGTLMPIPTFAAVDKPVLVSIGVGVVVAREDVTIGIRVMLDAAELEDVVELEDIGELENIVELKDTRFDNDTPSPSAQQGLFKGHHVPSVHSWRGTSRDCN
jgi:hypothetical protein